MKKIDPEHIKMLLRSEFGIQLFSVLLNLMKRSRLIFSAISTKLLQNFFSVSKFWIGLNPVILSKFLGFLTLWLINGEETILLNLVLDHLEIMNFLEPSILRIKKNEHDQKDIQIVKSVLDFITFWENQRKENSEYNDANFMQKKKYLIEKLGNIKTFEKFCKMMNRWIQNLNDCFDTLKNDLREKILFASTILIQRNYIWNCSSGNDLYKSLQVLIQRNPLLKNLNLESKDRKSSLKIEIVKISDNKGNNESQNILQNKIQNENRETPKPDDKNIKIEENLKETEENNKIDKSLENPEDSQSKNQNESDFMFFKPSLNQDKQKKLLTMKRSGEEFQSQVKKDEKSKVIEEFDLDDLLGHPDLNLS